MTLLDAAALTTQSAGGEALARMAAESTRLAEQSRFIESWHEFYLLAGTAAVTLVGLLFVSLSFHLDTLLSDARAHLLAHARETLFAFIYVLLLSLLFLVPHQPVRRLGFSVALLSLVVLAMSAARWIQSRGRHQASEHERFMHRRRRIAAIAYLGATVIGVMLFATRVDVPGDRELELLYMLIAVVCAMLGNAAGSAWDLLVQVGRIKRELAENKHR